MTISEQFDSLKIDENIFELAEDIELEYLVHYAAPYTGGDKCLVPKGTTFVPHGMMRDDAFYIHLAEDNDVLYDKMKQQVKEVSIDLFKRLKGFSFFITEEQLKTLSLITHNGSIERLLDIIVQKRKINRRINRLPPLFRFYKAPKWPNNLDEKDWPPFMKSMKATQEEMANTVNSIELFFREKYPNEVFHWIPLKEKGKYCDIEFSFNEIVFDGLIERHYPDFRFLDDKYIDRLVIECNKLEHIPCILGLRSHTSIEFFDARNNSPIVFSKDKDFSICHKTETPPNDINE